MVCEAKFNSLSLQSSTGGRETTTWLHVAQVAVIINLVARCATVSGANADSLEAAVVTHGQQKNSNVYFDSIEQS